MEREKSKIDKKIPNNTNLLYGGLVSQMLMDTPLMQQKLQEHQSIFGETIQRQNNATISDNLNNGVETVNGGLVSQMLMDTPLMQQKLQEHQSIFGETIQKQNNTGIPDNLKNGMETVSGINLDNVKVHYNSSKPTSVQAHAYTQGNEIHIASGQEKHLPHELGHVIQQAEGRVQATTTINGVAINDTPSLEKEATMLGEKALSSNITLEHEATTMNNNSETLQLTKGITTTINKTVDRKIEKVSRMRRKRKKKAWKKKKDMINDLQAEEEYYEEDDSQEFAEEDDIDEDYMPSVEELVDMVYDYGYEYGIEVVKNDIEVNESDLEGLFFEYVMKEEPLVNESFFESFREGFGEGYSDMQDEIKELGVSDYSLVEKVMLQEELEELIKEQQLYETFNINFDSEEHIIYPMIISNQPDIIVESNPTPMEQIIKDEEWSGITIPKNKIKSLKTTQQKAIDTLKDIAQNGRTKKKMINFKNKLSDIAKLLKGINASTIDVPKTDLTKSTHHGSGGNTEGIHVKAFPLSINSDTAGSPPQDGRLMASIRNLASQGAKDESKSYVQMHLLNDLVFGPGELWNLTPGPKQSNSDMESKIEDSLKRAILSKGLVINFEAIVEYQNDPNNASNQEIQQNPNKYRFSNISFKAEELKYNNLTDKWVKSSTPDADVSNINGKKIPWKYGSLSPLVPKPRILDINITVAELKAIGVKPDTATRIVNYVTKNHPVPLPSSNKKEELAEAIKTYDNGKKPNMNGWKATDVLWT